MSNPEQVCECGHGIEDHAQAVGACLASSYATGAGGVRISAGWADNCESYRHAAPSEPPVSDWERERRDAARFLPVVAGPGPCDRSPDEQDDELVELVADAIAESDDCSRAQWPGMYEDRARAAIAALAARPSADTETLRARVNDALDSLSRETGAYEAGYKGWALQVIAQVRAALDAR